MNLQIAFSNKWEKCKVSSDVQRFTSDVAVPHTVTDGDMHYTCCCSRVLLIYLMNMCDILVFPIYHKCAIKMIRVMQKVPCCTDMR